MEKNTITLEQAQEWVAKWKAEGANYLAKNQLKAFLIPGIDVTQVISEECTDVRSYLGLDVNNQPHLVIVGVDAKGNDMIDDTKGWYIYDFSHPCPSTCDVNSPLYIK
jgi:hypothetical protein